MGGAWSSWFGWFGQQQVRVLMLGLDGAGKTTVLYHLKLGEHVDTVPTVGFNCERVQFGRLQFTVWDVGGQDALRAHWRHFYKDSQALIYIIDSADTSRLTEARRELGKLLTEPELSGCPVLILANKQDQPNALRGAEVGQKLGVDKLRDTRPWLVQPCCALDGTGLEVALEWLSQSLQPSGNSSRRTTSAGT